MFKEAVSNNETSEIASSLLDEAFLGEKEERTLYEPEIVIREMSNISLSLNKMVSDSVISSFSLSKMEDILEYGKGDFPEHFLDSKQCFDNESNRDSLAVKSLAYITDPNQRLIFLRSDTGNSEESIKKLRLERSPLDKGVLDHYCTVTTLAPIIASGLALNVVDVDSKYNSSYPWSSDISMADMKYRNLVLLVDITKSKDHGDAMEKLFLSSISCFNKLNVVVLMAVITVDTEAYSIFKTDFPSAPISETTNVIFTISNLLNESILISSQNELLSLETALSRRIDPCVDKELNKCIKKELSKPRLEDELLILIERVLSDKEKKISVENLLSSVEAHNKEVIDLYKCFYISSKELKLKQAEDFFSLLGKDIIMDHWERIFRFPLASFMNEVNLRADIMEQAFQHDLPFWVIHNVLSSSNLESMANGVVLKSDMKFYQIPYNTPVNFDRPQNINTLFLTGHVAYVRRMRRFTCTLRDKKTGEEFRGSQARLQLTKLTSADIFSEERYEFKEFYEYSPGVQILINPLYYHEDSFKTFLNRKDKIPNVLNDSEEEEDILDSSGRPVDENEERFERIKSSMDSVERMIDSAILTDEEVNNSFHSISSIESKLAIIMRAKSSAQFSDQYQMSRTFTYNKIQMYLEQEYNLHRAINTSLVAGTPANYATLVNLAGVTSTVLVYVNAPAVSFKTTWIKVLSAGPRDMTEWTELGTLSESVLNIPTKGINLRKINLLVAVNEANMATTRLESKIGKEIVFACSKFYSIDSRHHDTALLRSHKTLARTSALMEARAELYTSNDNWLGWDKVRKSGGREFAKREIAYNLTGFLSNRQQNSISQGAFRYLHQSAVGVDSDLFGIIKKLQGIRLKWNVEIASYAKDIAIFSVAVLLKLKFGVNSIRAGNKEAFITAPDLLRASRDPHLNVSTYAMPSQFNSDKFNRTPSEAECMEIAWEQKRLYEESVKTHPNESLGMSNSDVNVLSIVLKGDSLLPDKIDALARVLPLSESHKRQLEKCEHPIPLITQLVSLGYFDIEESIERIFKIGRGIQYTKTLWVILLATLSLKREVGSYGPISNLSGRSISSLFTTAGSLFCPEVKGLENVESIRKTTAATLLLVDRSDPGSVKTKEDLAGKDDVILRSRYKFIDYFDIIMCLIYGILSPVFLIQFSEKDAEGKDREISTLHIYFAALCAACEESARALSMNVPEDLITESNKEAVFSRMITKSVSSKNRDSSNATVFMSCDMKKYGPNIMNEVNMLSAAILSPDRNTFKLFHTTIEGSSRKVVRPPHNLIRQALRPYGVLNRSSGEYEYIPALSENEFPCYLKGKTASTMLKLHNQYHKGNENGPKGTICVNVPQGMPGQGIFTITCSINHAAAVRYLIRTFKRIWNWEVWSVVTSDDSLTTVTFPSKDMTFLSKALRIARASLLSLFGLLDNESKLNIVYLRPEINSFYHLSTEAIQPVWRFVGAYISLQTSANLQEDLILSVASGADTCKVGGTHYIASIVSALRMILTLDAHHAWSLYYSSLTKWMKDKEEDDNLLFQVPECFGLPSLDPASAVLSPLGTRAASMSYCYTNDTIIYKYSKWLASKIFEIPTITNGSVPSDTQLGFSSSLEDLYILKDPNYGGEISVLPQVLMPHITGITGLLRRRKGTLRISRELGKDVVSLRAYARPGSSSFSPLSIISNVLSNLSRPLDKGEYDLSAHIQFSDLQHSYDFPCLKIAPECLLTELKGFVSRKQVFDILLKPGRIRQIRKDFENMITNEDRVPAWGADIAEEISKDIILVADISRDNNTSRLIKDLSYLGGVESSKELSQPRRVQKRVVNIGRPQNILIEWDKIEKGIICSLQDPKDYQEMEQSLKRKIRREELKGNLSSARSNSLLISITQRIKNTLSSRYQMVTYVRNSSRTYDQCIDDFLTLNATLGHRSLRRGASFLERSQALNIRAGEAIGYREEVLATVRNHYYQNFLNAIRGSHDKHPSVLSSINFSPNSIQDMSIKGFKGLIRSMIRPLKDTYFLASLSCSDVGISLSFEQFESVFLISSLQGWVGNSSEKYKVEGKVAEIGSSNDRNYPVYSLIFRRYNFYEERREYRHIFFLDQLPELRDIKLRFTPAASETTKMLLSNCLETTMLSFKKTPKNGAIDVAQIVTLKSIENFKFDSLSFHSAISFEHSGFNYYIPLSRLPQNELQDLPWTSPKGLISLKPPKASSYFNDYKQFLQIIVKHPMELEHDSFYPEIEGSISSLFKNSTVEEQLHLKSWSSTVLTSMGAKNGIPVLKNSEIPDSNPIWVFDIEDSWEDVNPSIQMEHIIIKDQEGQKLFSKIEWLEDLSLQLSSNSLKAFNDATIRRIALSVLEEGYNPKSFNLYLASYIYYYITGRELQGSMIVEDTWVSSFSASAPTSGNLASLKLADSENSKSYLKKGKDQDENSASSFLNKKKLLPLMNLDELGKLMNLDKVDQADMSFEEKMNLPLDSEEEIFRSLKAHAEEMGRDATIDYDEQEEQLMASIRAMEILKESSS